LLTTGQGLAQTAGFGNGERSPERSVSGQFVVYSGRVADASSSLSRLATNAHYVYLRSPLLLVSSERIKQTVWHELGITGPWAGKIHIVLYPASSPVDMVTIVSERFRDGWQYRMEMPDLLDRTKYLRAMAQVLLLEYANRAAGERSAEIPFWLIEGLAAEVLLSSEKAVIPPVPTSGGSGLAMSETFREARRQNPLQEAHRLLATQEPLTFEELSWPRPEHFEGDQAGVYRASAQLLVARLERLPGGRLALRSMVEQLPRHQNWQFAFLNAFQPQFQRPLDVEKWWTLQLAHFTGRDLTEMLSSGESWTKLDELLREPVLVRSRTNDLPLRSEVPLQTVLREWGLGLQYPALQSKVRELEAFQLRAPPEAAVLADEYRQLLAAYLPDPDKLAAANPKKLPKPRRDAGETARALSVLDQRRADFSNAAAKK